jgi:hypothetical protein
MSNPTRRWLRKAEVYRHFVREEEGLDWSPEAAQAMFDWESRGSGDLGAGIFSSSSRNGYARGKKVMDLTVAMWQEDLREGLLTKNELRLDWPQELLWWLDETLSGMMGGPSPIVRFLHGSIS